MYWPCVFALMVGVSYADVLGDLFSSIAFVDTTEDKGEERVDDGRSTRQSSNLLFEKHQEDLRSLDSLRTFFGFRRTSDLSFQWSDCGGKSDPVRINSITLSPDPIKVPGQVTFGFHFQLNTKISAPVSLDVEIKKKVAFVWVKVRTYNFPDFCTNIGKVTCPTKFPNCHCPFNNGDYILPPSLLQVTQVQVPGGQYQVTGWFKQNNVEVACVWSQVSVS